jgi:hypothetical protein
MSQRNSITVAGHGVLNEFTLLPIALAIWPAAIGGVSMLPLTARELLPLPMAKALLRTPVASAAVGVLGSAGMATSVSHSGPLSS